MLKSLKISNFCSIGTEQEIVFAISAKDKLDDSAVEMAGEPINLVNCVIGANASGKTTLLKAITFLFWLINRSYDSTQDNRLIPLNGHKLHPNEDTKIEVTFFEEEKLFKYSVLLDSKYIRYEFLGEKSLRGYKRIFEYTRKEDAWHYFKTSLVINKEDQARFEQRKTASLLSSLIQTGYLPQLKTIKNRCANVTAMGRRDESTGQKMLDLSSHLYKNPNLKRELLSLIKSIDIDIADIILNEVSNEINANVGKLHWMDFLHKTKAGDYKLSFIDQSNGTRQALSLLSEIIPLLKTGGVVVLDELDSGLHPQVAQRIISLFEDPEINQGKAQLFFSTHQHILLNDRTKTQIFIVEKKPETSETEIFRLDEVKGVRNTENYFEKYITGTYGGVPRIKWASS